MPAVRELVLASDELGAIAELPAGLLRINVARAGHMIVMQPVLRRFLDRYPEIRIDISVENSLVDIVGRGFDAGIRFGDLVERDMVAVKVGPAISAWILGLFTGGAVLTRLATLVWAAHGWYGVCTLGLVATAVAAIVNFVLGRRRAMGISVNHSPAE